MTNKIIVEVYVPVLGQKYDVLIPINKKIQNVTRLINEAIIELSNGCYSKKDNVVLYNRETGMLLEPKLNVKEVGLVNGSQVILI